MAIHHGPWLRWLVALGATQFTAPAQQLAHELQQGRHSGISGFVQSAANRIEAQYADAQLAAAPPDLRSVTKSLTALLVGIAIDRGEIASVHAPVVDYLPQYRQWLAQDPRKLKLRIEDLLSMRSGLACDDWNAASPGHEDRMYRRRDWVEFWARQAVVSEPATQFAYCTGNAVALGKILSHASGLSVEEYAARHLFAPLGITDARWARWNRGKDVDSGGHLRLAPRDLLRIGQLLLDGGKAGDRQVVSPAWLAQMTTPRVAVPGHAQHYGYLWWIDRTHDPALPATRLWMAWGNGGNYLLVMPELGSVVVFTATRFNRADAIEPLQWLRDRLLPAMRGGTRPAPTLQ